MQFRLAVLSTKRPLYRMQIPSNKKRGPKMQKERRAKDDQNRTPSPQETALGLQHRSTRSQSLQTLSVVSFIYLRHTTSPPMKQHSGSLGEHRVTSVPRVPCLLLSPRKFLHRKRDRARSPVKTMSRLPYRYLGRERPTYTIHAPRKASTLETT